MGDGSIIANGNVISYYSSDEPTLNFFCSLDCFRRYSAEIKPHGNLYYTLRIPPKQCKDFARNCILLLFLFKSVHDRIRVGRLLLDSKLEQLFLIANIDVFTFTGIRASEYFIN